MSEMQRWMTSEVSDKDLHASDVAEDERCPVCDGAGNLLQDVCPLCLAGTPIAIVSEVTDKQLEQVTDVTEDSTCPVCDGTEELMQDLCPLCVVGVPLGVVNEGPTGDAFVRATMDAPVEDVEERMIENELIADICQDAPCPASDGVLCPACDGTAILLHDPCPLCAPDNTLRNLRVESLTGEVLLETNSLNPKSTIADLRSLLEEQSLHRGKLVQIKVVLASQVLDESMALESLPSDPVVTLQALCCMASAETAFGLLKDSCQAVRQTAAQTLMSVGTVAQRLSAIEALVTVGAPAVHDLGAALRDADPSVRSRAAQSLAELGPTPVPFCSEFVELLRDADTRVRRKAGAVIGKLYSVQASALEMEKDGCPSVIPLLAKVESPAPHLVKLLQDKDDGVRARAAAALGKLKELAAPYAAELLPLLRDRAGSVRRSAASSLGMIGMLAAAHGSALADLLRDTDSGVRVAAAAALGKMGSHAASCAGSLASLVRDTDDEVRREAVAALGSMGLPAAMYAAEVAQLLRNADHGLRRVTVETLASFGVLCMPFAADIAALLEDPDVYVRREVVKALHSLGMQAVRPHTEKLLKALNDSDFRVQSLAVKALGLLGPTATQTVADAVAECTKHVHRIIRAAAADAIGEFTSAGSSHADKLAKLLHDEDYEVRGHAVRSLGKLGATTARTQAAEIANLLSDSDSGVRKNATWALGITGEAQHVPDLLKQLSDSDRSIRYYSAEALGSLAQHQLWGRGQGASLVPLIHDSDHRVRSSAIEALSQLGPSARSQADDISASLKDLEHDVRGIAALALAKTRHPIAPHLDLLISMLSNDESHSVRARAAEALCKVVLYQHSDLNVLNELTITHKEDILRALQDADPEVRRHVAEVAGGIVRPVSFALAREHCQAFIEALELLRHDCNMDVRRSATTSLEKIRAQLQP